MLEVDAPERPLELPLTWRTSPRRLDLTPARCQKQFVRRPILAPTASPANAGRGIRVAICGLLALAQLSLLSHAALVTHRTCALHGEAIHTSGVTVSPRLDFTPDAAAPAAADPADHDHCLSLAVARERFLPESPAHDGAPALALAPDHAIPAIARPTPGIALLSLAPKSSPPS